MKLLLHCCCGPCTLGAVAEWRERGAELAAWFFNPNLHPAEERERRQGTFGQAAEALGLATRAAGPETTRADFLLALAAEGGPRCHACYRLRLEAAAREAVASGREAFSTTLLISPYQDLEALRRIGEEVGARHGVAFAFVDLRPRFREAQQRAQELGLYRQNYCGCLFSDLERAQRRAQRALDRLLNTKTTKRTKGRDGPSPRSDR